MPRPAENTQNLAEGSQESLRALIQAIIPEASTNSDGKLSSDAVTLLAEKLTEMMGPEAPQGFKQSHNESGELVNEEGLPIIDITESNEPGTRSIPPPITVEPLIPLASLPTATRERLRDKRNRILDLLEEEERQTEVLEAKRESQEKEEILPKRTEEAAREKDKLKEAREFQKKMGRALLQNMSKAKEKNEKEEEARRIQDEEADKHRSPSIKKKTVAFAETPEQDVKETKVETPNRIDWGDLTPGILRSTKRPTLMSQSLLDKHPMKMSVVERLPGAQLTQPKTSFPPQQQDSDDESEPENEADSVDGDVSIDEEQILEQVDLDFAQHQREIALEYHKKRGTIGQEAAAAMANHIHGVDEEMDIDAEVSREPLKPAISQFRASRLAFAYSTSAPNSVESVSTSLGASVIPESSTRTIQRAIKTGRLDDDGRLIGAEAESESEDEGAAMQDVLELLRKGEVYNLGPEGEYLHTVPAQASSLAPHVPVSAPSSQPDGSKLPNGLPPPSMRSKTLKFKASRAAAGRPPTSNQMTISSTQRPENSSTAPLSQVSRSSPKLDTPTTMSAGVAERIPLAAHSSAIQSRIQSPPTFSMIVDSPSFPTPRNAAISASSQPSTGSLPAMVRTSPSFPPQNVRRPDRPPTVIASTVRETKAAPSPVPPASSVPAVTIDSPSFPPAQNQRWSNRPPVVMTASVRESRPPTSTQPAGRVTPEHKPEKKTSRFKAERAGS
ncbi:hypothetical protein CPB84DRAFT_1761183 [Gymnopilus junonius]|uniref:DUF3835 domain-containing protein n=1 Tax=Gymnopilus junonius TaxID=109634 RepID=A0A9P5NWX9_GYMJU|nr:hypothetical protein CPB84DRAFT_1761183 [Gymnopilus junonius]